MEYATTSPMIIDAFPNENKICELINSNISRHDTCEDLINRIINFKNKRSLKEHKEIVQMITSSVA